MKKTNILQNITFTLLVFTISLSLSACSKKDSNAAQSGRIEYTLDGKTYVQTDDIGATFVSGKFMGLTDGNVDAKVGDSQEISIVVGTTYNKIRLYFIADGKMYGSGASTLNNVTFTKNDSNLLEGTFEGQVKLDGDIANPAKTITGKFTVKKITRI